MRSRIAFSFSDRLEVTSCRPARIVGPGDHDTHCQSVLGFGVLAASNLLHEVELEQQLGHAVHIQALGVVGGVLHGFGDLLLALFHELVVVEVAAISRHAEIAGQIFCTGTLFTTQQRLVKLLAMAGADDAHFVLRLLHEAENGLGENLDGGCRSLLHKDVAIVAVGEGVQHQIHRIVQRHHETGHVGIGDGDRLAVAHLIHKQRNHRAAGRHHVAVAGAANDGAGALQVAGSSNHHLLHHRLGDTHGVDRVHRLVGGQAHDALDLIGDGRLDHVLGAEHIGAYCLHRVEFAGRNLLEGSGVENVINTAHRGRDGVRIAHVTDVELQLAVVVKLPHVVLLLLVTGEDADFTDIGIEETAKNGVAERAGATGNEKSLSSKHKSPQI